MLCYPLESVFGLWRCTPKPPLFFGPEGLSDPPDPGTTVCDGAPRITGATEVTTVVGVSDRRNTGASVAGGGGGA